MKKYPQTSLPSRAWPIWHRQKHHPKWQQSTTGLLAHDKRFSKKKFVSVAVGSLLLLSSASPALHAGTITVTEPIIGGPNGCDLVEAIHAANSDKDNDCTGTDNDLNVNDADTILFATSPDTINLTSAIPSTNAGYGDNGLPVITSPLTIDGAPNNIAIIRNSPTAFRILEVDGLGGNGGELTLSKVTIHNGRVSGTTNLGYKSDAQGGGLLIHNGAILTVKNSIISSNTAIFGGGISAIFSSLMTIDNSTVISNTADHSGGGLWTRSSSSMKVINSRVVSNQSDNGAAIYAKFTSPVAIAGSNIISNTATDRGGGIFASSTSTVTVESSIISTNSADRQGGGIYIQSSSPTIVSGSIIRDNVAESGGGIHAGNSSPLSVYESIIENNNGGAVIISNSAVRILSSTIASNSGGGIQANTSSRVTVESSIIQSNTAIFGGGIQATSYSPVKISRSTIESNKAYASGGGIFVGNSSPVTIDNSIIISNMARDGGGIFAHTLSQVTMESSSVSVNIAERYGGGIRAGHSSHIKVDNSSITSNQANDGGGIWVSSSSVRINQSGLFTNTAISRGGALYIYDGNAKSVNIDKSCIVGNVVNAIYSASNYMTITAQANWWGASDGPGGALGGSGDSVSDHVDGSNFLTEPLLDCLAILPDDAVAPDEESTPTTLDEDDEPFVGRIYLPVISR